MNTSTYKKLAYSGMVATMFVSPSSLTHYHDFQRNKKTIVPEYACQAIDMYTQEIDSSSETEASSKYERFQDESLSSDTKIVADAIQYTKKSFCYEKNTYLNFYDPFMLKFGRGIVTLLPHSISFPCRNVREFDISLIKFIQLLLRKADRGTLDNMEKKAWLAMLKLFDYKQFSLDLAPPMYEEFKITSLNTEGKFVLLERCEDGKINKCSIDLIRSFTNGRFKEGNCFGAWIKRDHRDHIIEINQPTLIEEEFVSEDEWNQIAVI